MRYPDDSLSPAHVFRGHWDGQTDEEVGKSIMCVLMAPFFLR